MCEFLPQLNGEKKASRCSFHPVLGKTVVGRSVKRAIDFNSIKEGERYFTPLLEKLVSGYFKKELAPYFIPSYRRRAFKDREELVARVENAMRSYSSGVGIAVKNFVVVGNIGLPDMKTFYEGLRYLGELMDVEKNNKKELIILNNKLQTPRKVLMPVEVIIRNSTCEKNMN